ncbi:MAG TPA: KpsF/GutQ family sugar-phosphate isomerase [bacterium]|nr:KpsF/GutQ family sugar-phosphate isomerase [bacterium]
MNKIHHDLERAQFVLRTEAAAVSAIADRLDDSFLKAIELIESCKGRVVVAGVGKSGLVGRKNSATLASTGTPALFLHPAEGAHGDLGMLVNQDVVILLSNSGETREIIDLLPWMKRIGARIISMIGRANSTLGKFSDVVLDVSVEREACPHNLAPTASTAAQLALGDALAIVLLQRRNFQPEDFAVLHPGGSLARQLLRVEDVMHSGAENPVVQAGAGMADAIGEISSKAMGAVSVVDGKGVLLGIITDGDLRRSLSRMPDILSRKVEEVMTQNPITISVGKMAAEAIAIMENRPSQIAVLPVVDENKHAVGMVRLHDLVRAGL